MSTPNEPEHTSPIVHILRAVQFLTIIPVQLPEMDSAANMSGSLPWFPLVGSLIGAIAALFDWLLRPLVDIPVRSVMVLIIYAVLTGLLHLDGFIDSCDGLVGFRTPERRMEIMRDSRVGAYGVIGAVLLLLTQLVALDSLVGAWRTMAILLAPVMGRWAMVYAIHAFPYGRTQGAASAFQGTQFLSVLYAALVALGLSAIIVSPLISSMSIASIFAHVVLVGGVAVVCSFLWTQWAARRLNGVLTGDTYGALNEIVVTCIWLTLPVISNYTHLLIRSLP